MNQSGGHNSSSVTPSFKSHRPIILLSKCYNKKLDIDVNCFVFTKDNTVYIIQTYT